MSARRSSQLASPLLEANCACGLTIAYKLTPVDDARCSCGTRLRRTARTVVRPDLLVGHVVTVQCESCAAECNRCWAPLAMDGRPAREFAKQAKFNGDARTYYETADEG